MNVYSVITGLGSYIPTVIKKNEAFLENEFLNDDGSPFEYENEIVFFAREDMALSI